MNNRLNFFIFYFGIFGALSVYSHSQPNLETIVQLKSELEGYLVKSHLLYQWIFEVDPINVYQNDVNTKTLNKTLAKIQCIEKLEQSAIEELNKTKIIKLKNKPSKPYLIKAEFLKIPSNLAIAIWDLKATESRYPSLNLGLEFCGSQSDHSCKEYIEQWIKQSSKGR